MPTSLGSSLFIFAGFLTTVSDTAACIVAGAAVAFEAVVFYSAGTQQL